MMHFHGTPITPRTVLHELAGRCFCVRYGEHRDIEVCHEIGQSVMLDNGAFPAWTQGKATDWPGYYQWCARWLEHWTTWAVIPDVIDGDEEANDALIAEWPFGGRGAPVWHMHESLARLARLVAGWPLVCVGSSGDYATLGTPAWTRRMAAAMDTACDTDGVPLTRLHMLRGLAYAGGPYPFYSADSTNVARNHAGTNGGRARKSALRMAAEIDALQTPARWRRGGRAGGVGRVTRTLSSIPQGESKESRYDPHGRIWIKMVDKGSLVTIRPWGSLTERTISYGTWITWDRRP